jgi:hypothetical protein
MKRLELDRETAAAICEMHAEMGTWDRNGGPAEVEVQATLELLQGIGDLPKTLKPGDVADLSYIGEVLDKIGRE